jgi:hypothetical protein
MSLGERVLAAELRPEIRWLASGFLLMLCSGFGQRHFWVLPPLGA